MISEAIRAPARGPSVRVAGALVNEVEFRRCQQDFLYFFRTYWYVQTPAHESGRVLFDPWPEQENIIRSVLSEKKVLALKARQIGYSTLISAICFWEGFFFPGRLFIMLSRRERDSIKLLKKVIFGYRHLPEWMKARGPKRIDRGKLEFTLDNDSQMVSMPSLNDPARGDAAYRIVIDEWAFFENAEDVWASIEPAVDVGGRVFALSTAKGFGNAFHEFWIGATDGTNGFIPIFKSWRANPARDDAWYESKVAELPEWQRFQEYPSTPQEAFRRSGKNVFSVDICLEMLEHVEVGTPMEIGYRGEILEAFPASYSDLVVYELPRSGFLYTIGADTAANVAGGDYSVSLVVRSAGWIGEEFVPATMVARFRSHIDPSDFTAETHKLAQFYGDALIVPEANTFGLQVINELRTDFGYWNIYRQMTSEGRKRIGFYTSRTSKPLVIGQCRRMIADREIAIFDKVTINELMGYVQVDTAAGASKLQGSPHDDCVIALALAIEGLNEISADVAEYSRQTTTSETFEQMIAAEEAETVMELETIGRRAPERNPWFIAA